MPHALKI